MQSTVTGMTPFRRATSHVLVALLVSVICWPLAAAPAQRGMSDKEKVTLAVNGDRGTLRLQLGQAIAGADAPTLTVTNDDKFVWWKAPLTAAGDNVWTAPLDRKAVEALLVGTKLVATFPKASKGDDLIVVALVETVRPMLADVGPIMAGAMPFFNPPTQPARPDLPGGDSGVRAMEEFVNAALNWDRRMMAYRYDYAAAVSRSRALWMDLVTAGRVPWLKGSQQADAYAASVESRKAEIEQTRETFRREATQFVQAWNNSHAKGGQPALELKFDQTA